MERVQMARHPDRPYSLDIIATLFDDFVEVHGDRRYSDDPAMIAGFARLDGVEVCVIGQQKGRDINDRRHRNFAMSKPEGYRKALRMMKLAEKFGRPVITIIDTPGAYPGIGAEDAGAGRALRAGLHVALDPPHPGHDPHQPYGALAAVGSRALRRAKRW